MTPYYSNSSLSWADYLQAEAYVQELNKTIRKSSDRLHDTVSEGAEQLRYTVSEGAEKIVASNEALRSAFQEGFDEINRTVVKEFGFLGKQISALEQGIEGLGAAFSYGISLLASQLEVQNKILSDILERLDVISQTLSSPTLTQAREFYNIGRGRLAKGLLDKALESFHRAEEKNDTDFLTHYSIGHLYLYGINEHTNVIDISKAEKHFRVAARYAEVEIDTLPEARAYCGKAYFHAAIACYVQAVENHRVGDVSQKESVLHEAVKLASKATQVYPELTESFYQHAKCAALLGNTAVAIGSLEAAIRTDRNYCLKVDTDPDFNNMRAAVLHLFERLRQQASTKAQQALKETSELLERQVFLTDKSYQVKEQIKCLIEAARQAYQRGALFDYQDSFNVCNQTRSILESLSLELSNTFEVRSGGKALFSPDSRYIAVSPFNGQVLLRKLPSGELVLDARGKNYSVYYISYDISPDGALLAVTYDRDQNIYLYEVTSGQQVAVLRRSQSPLFDWSYSRVNFSPEGMLLSSVYNVVTGTVHVQMWDVYSQTMVKTILEHVFPRTEHSRIVSVNFSPNKQYMFISALDASSLWTVDPPRKIIDLELKENSLAFTFSSDCTKFAIATGGKRNAKALIILDVPSGLEIDAVSIPVPVDFGSHVEKWEAHIRAMAFSPNNQYLSFIASANEDDVLDVDAIVECIFIYEVSSKKIIAKKGVPYLARTYDPYILSSIHSSLCFSPDGRYLVTGGCSEPKVRMRKVPSLEVVATLEQQEMVEGTRSTPQTFSPCGKYLAIYTSTVNLDNPSASTHTDTINLYMWSSLSIEALQALEQRERDIEQRIQSQRHSQPSPSSLEVKETGRRKSWFKRFFG